MVISHMEGKAQYGNKSLVPTEVRAARYMYQIMSCVRTLEIARTRSDPFTRRDFRDVEILKVGELPDLVAPTEGADFGARTFVRA